MKLNVVLLTLTIILIPIIGYGAPKIKNLPIPKINMSVDVDKPTTAKEVALSIQLLILLTILALAPSIIIMMTSYVRVYIVLSFVRNALATQQLPPNQVLAGLALFLTFFIMSPTIRNIYQNAAVPMVNEKIGYEQAYNKGVKPIREFMFKQTSVKDIALFVFLSKIKRPKNRNEVPTFVLIPSFIISELKTAFTMGLVLFIPFILIDIMVASTLMSMGMIMVPPVMISFPLKILLFVLVDGWGLLTKSLVESFH